jgi:hypothetical protein
VDDATGAGVLAAAGLRSVEVELGRGLGSDAPDAPDAPDAFDAEVVLDAPSDGPSFAEGVLPPDEAADADDA